MRLRLFILFFLSIIVSLCSFGQSTSEFTQSRILILLDESSSMLQPWAGGKEKHQVANQIILKLIDSVYSVNPDVEFSLRVFGSQYGVLEHNCTDTKNEVPFSKYNKTQMEFRLDDIQPYGGTCIAYSLSEAADKDLVDEEHIAYSIVLVTDGGESCDGNICAVMTRLLARKIYFKPYILSLEDVSGLKDEYACLGNYLPITKKSDINKAVGTIVQSFRPMLTLSKEQYTTIQKAGIPSVLHVGSSPVMVEKKDTIKTTKTRIKPIETIAVKPVDTIATVKKEEPPKSKIVVGEEMKLPPPKKLKKTAFTKPLKLFVAPPATYKTKDIAIASPVIQLPEPPPVLPPPVKMAVIRPSAVKKYKTTKVPAYEAVDVLVSLPEIKLPEPPAVKPDPVKLAKLTSNNRITKLKITKPGSYTPEDVAVAPPVIKVKEPEVAPVAPTPIKMASVKVSKVKKYPVDKPGSFSPRNISVAAPEIKVKEPQAPPPVAVEPKVERPVIKMAKIKPAKISKWHLLYGGEFFDEKVKLIKIQVEPKFKPIATTLTPVKPTTPPGPKKIDPKVNTGEYSVTQEDAKETSMVVYLTNGKGKYYPVTPRVILTDAATNKEIKKFYRTVDMDGQPDPVTNISTGKYYLTIEGRDDLIASVDILPNKRTRVEIIVKKYSLYFYYEGAPNRPVKEFNARVIQRNVANGKVIEQKCTEKLEYEPGNYHVNISTFPEDVRNIDLESNSEGGIAIKQPGFVKFTNDVKAPSVTLNKQMGDRFVQFYTLNLNDPASSHLQIQPGKYQVIYNNGTSKFSSSNKVLEFFIKSNEETEVILK